MFPSKPFTLLFAAVAALPSIATAAESRPMAERVSEEAQLLLSIRSFQDLRAQWERHPLKELGENEGLLEYWREVFGTDQGDDSSREGFVEVLETEFGLTVDQLFELFPGSAGLAWFNLDEVILRRADHPDLLILAEYAGEPERLHELMQIQFERNAEAQREENPAMEHRWVEESFMGETLRFDEAFDGENTYVEDGYALVDGIFILGAPEERLRAAVESIKGVGPPPLSETAAHLRVREESGATDFGVFFNLSTLLPPLNAALTEQSGRSGMAMAGVTPATLDRALALDALEAFAVDFKLTGRGAEFYSALLFEEKRGLLSLMTYSGDPLPAAPFVPDSVLATSVSSFDLGAMSAALEKLLTVGSPNLPALMDIQMQNLRNQTGIDLRSAVLENFGDELVTLSALDELAAASELPYQLQQIYLVELIDPAAFERAIEAFKDLAPGLRARMQTREVHGKTIHTMKGFAGPEAPHDSVNDLSYVITRSHLIVNTGGIGLLQELLGRLEGSDGGFWEDPETEARFDSIARPDPVTRSYLDLEKMLQTAFRSMARMLSLGGLGRQTEPGESIGALEFPYSLVTEMNEASDGFFSRGALLRKEARP